MGKVPLLYIFLCVLFAERLRSFCDKPAHKSSSRKVECFVRVFVLHIRPFSHSLRQLCHTGLELAAKLKNRTQSKDPIKGGTAEECICGASNFLPLEPWIHKLARSEMSLFRKRKESFDS